MATKIRVNGTTYDSVDAMPPEVRRFYEQALVHLPGLPDPSGDCISEDAQEEGLSVRRRTLVKKKLIVNGVMYDDESQMPSDVRRLYDQAMQKAGMDPTVTTNDIKFSFHLTGPGFSLRKSTGAPSRTRTGPPVPAPIEPSSESSVRLALVVGACAVAGLLFWFLMRAR